MERARAQGERGLIDWSRLGVGIVRPNLATKGIAMVTIAIRDVERHISALLQRVQSGRETIEITDAGHVVVRIVPAEPETIAPRGGEIRRVWEARDKLAREIGATWPEGLSAADAIDQDRRDL